MYFRSVFMEICNHSHFLKVMTLLNTKTNVAILIENFLAAILYFENGRHQISIMSITLWLSEIWWLIWWLFLYFVVNGNGGAIQNIFGWRPCSNPRWLPLRTSGKMYRPSLSARPSNLTHLYHPGGVGATKFFWKMYTVTENPHSQAGIHN